jgi:hypothetical protein
MCVFLLMTSMVFSGLAILIAAGMIYDAINEPVREAFREAFRLKRNGSLYFFRIGRLSGSVCIRKA